MLWHQTLSALVLLLVVSPTVLTQSKIAALDQVKRIFADSGLPGAAFAQTTLSPTSTEVPTYSPPNYAKHEKTVEEEVDRAGILEAFVDPLAKLAAPPGEHPSRNTAQIANLVNSLPKLVRIVPNLTPTKISPDLLRHIMSGGQLPGVPRDTLETLVAMQMRRMAQVAARVNAGKVVPEERLVMPPIDLLPPSLVQDALAGRSLKGLTRDETIAISTYYLNRLTRLTTTSEASAAPSTSTASPLPGVISGLSTKEVIARLPPGFDLSRVPTEVIADITSSRPFDIRRLPDDMLQQFREHNPDLEVKIAEALNRESAPTAEPTGNTTKSSTATTNDAAIVRYSEEEWILAYDLGRTEEDTARKQRIVDNEIYQLTLFMYFGISVAVFAVISLIFVVLMCARHKGKLEKRSIVPSPRLRLPTISDMEVKKPPLPTPLIDDHPVDHIGPTAALWSLDISAIPREEHPPRTVNTSTPHRQSSPSIIL